VNRGVKQRVERLERIQQAEQQSPAICPCCGRPLSAEAAIERYYRSRAAGSRKTLRQIAMETIYSYDYLRKVKRQYDADGKWGSKKAYAHQP